MTDFRSLRESMVERQIAGRGIDDERLLQALREVPREHFVPERLHEFAYEDSPLPIAAGQTISQPYIVAAMIDALHLEPDDTVLEVGVGSGYAAAVMSRMCRAVYGVERHAELAEAAEERYRGLGYDNVHVRHGDGTLGWPEHAPYDAESVAAAGPDVPRPLLDQLAVGGRLVIPVGSQRAQELVRIVRRGEDDYERQELGGVRFVPLIGAAGWTEEGNEAEAPAVVEAPEHGTPERTLASLVHECSHPFTEVEGADLGVLLERIGDARVVLLGEATHGTSEFYRFRARLTRELVRRKGFNVVALEADWPDAARVDGFVRGRPDGGAEGGGDGGRAVFSRFPTWMWRNREFEALVAWLRDHNAGRPQGERVSLHGLDLYSLHASIEEVLRYLERVDPEAAEVARARYGCLTPWEQDPALYGRAALSGRYRSCEEQVVAALRDLLERRMEYAGADGERFLDAEGNARVVADAERYYRVMYYGSRESWNLRDRHMFETLQRVLDFRSEHGGGPAKAVVWEHNSHLGDAAATEMGSRGEINVGHLCRQHYGDGSYAVGFGTDRGTVAAASSWGGPLEVQNVRPSHADSYERVCHDTELPAFVLPLRQPERDELRDELMEPRLERAIGVIYRPETELASHYFQAVLPEQFDAWVWFDESRAVEPLPASREPGVPDTWPFGL